MVNPAPLCSPMTHLSLTVSTEHILQPMREVVICCASLPGGPVALNTVVDLPGGPVALNTVVDLPGVLLH